jgi:hypothetical protein
MKDEKKAPNSTLEPNVAHPWPVQPQLDPVLARAAENAALPVPSDRLYQVAAMTAGFFLLATLL